MTLTTAPLRTAAAAVCAHEGAEITALARPELLALMRDVTAARKAADVLLAQAAAEVDRRSRIEHGHDGLAAREGYRSARELIAGSTGGSMAEAQRLVDTGGLLADAGAGLSARGSSTDGAGWGADASGDEGPSAEGSHVSGGMDAPHISHIEEVKVEVARCVNEGTIGVDVASMFSRSLAGLPDNERTRDGFLRALGKAPGLPAHRVRELVWRAQAHADPRAWEQREAEQYEARSVTLRDEAGGMVVLTARLTPLMAAPIKMLLDAGVTRAMQQRRDDPDSDPRTPWQMRADHFVDMSKHLLDCDQPTNGVKMTVVVRTTRESLESGLGVAEIDGMAQPLSAGALRRAAADAEVIPMVMGAGSEVLDVGRSKRYFTAAQRTALVERDAGCSWCHAPPSWCEAHHIEWWERDEGPTDLKNGLMLCTRCHHRVHRENWGVEVREHPEYGSAVWFTPPASVDPLQVPRMGGRARYGLTDQDLVAA